MEAEVKLKGFKEGKFVSLENFEIEVRITMNRVFKISAKAFYRFYHSKISDEKGIDGRFL